MEESPCILVLDCGATSVRAMLVDDRGRVVGKARQANESFPGEESPDYHIWDADRILSQLAECAREAMIGSARRAEDVVGVTVTSFGVDGALVDAEGKLLYPVISWKCPRTTPIMDNIGKYMGQEELNRLSGVGAFTFNTIYKLIWLRENRPELFERAKAWLFISSLFNYRLTGEMTTDRTMAGTSQLTDLRTGDFSPEILRAIGVSRELFPRMVSPGDIVGCVTSSAAEMFGICAGIPVLSAGHDTQFAVFGSGAVENQPVLSSGTWEILMVRSERADLSVDDYDDGATVEYDAETRLRNPGLQWLGSGVIEWLKALVYPRDSYDIMDAEAEDVPPGSEGVTMQPDFLPSSATKGSFSGLVLGKTRAHLYRATMEALAYRLKHRLGRLESIAGFEADSLVLVGGGSKNKVWAQIRADILDRPIRITHEAEITVLGAVMFAFAGLGRYPSPEVARDAFGLSYEIIKPGKHATVYRDLE